jgi:quercetin dioxygenase-like cupin family protein
MTALNRRTVFVAGLGSAAAVTLVAGRAEAEHYPPGVGQPVPEATGDVRRVNLSERPSTIPGYSKVRMFDIVFSPGSSEPVEEMPADMVCHCTEGELTVTNDGKEFVAKAGHVWTCRKGGTEGLANKGSSQAVMRVVVLAA